MKLWNCIEQFLKRNTLRYLEKTLGKSPLDPTGVDFQRMKRILIVRQHDQLGDLLLSSPAFRALKERFPQAHISLIARNYTSELLLHHRYLDEVILFHEVGYNWRPSWIKDFVKKLISGYDLTVVLNTVSHSLTSDLMAYFSRARYILGSADRVFPGCRRNFFYNLIAPFLDGERHQTDRNLDILRYLGIDTDNKREVITLTEEEMTAAEAYLRGEEISSADLVVGVHPGAGKPKNRWGVSNFARVANRLYQGYGAKILVTWGPKEEKLGREFLQELNFRAIVLTGLSLRKLAAVLSKLSLFLCNDTGVMHLAAAVGTPLVAIFGPSDPNQWKPIGEKFVALRGSNGRCDSVQVEEVISKVKEILGLNH